MTEDKREREHGGGGHEDGDAESFNVKAERQPDGNIRVQCPIDKSEHFLAPGTKEFTCPIDGSKLIISNGV